MTSFTRSQSLRHNPPRALRKHILGHVEGRVRKSAARIDLNYGCSGVMDRRNRLRFDLARRKQPQTAFDAVDCVRLTVVPLPRNDDARDGARALRAHHGAFEDPLDTRQQGFLGNDMHLPHVRQHPWGFRQGKGLRPRTPYLSTSM